VPPAAKQAFQRALVTVVVTRQPPRSAALLLLTVLVLVVVLGRFFSSSFVVWHSSFAPPPPYDTRPQHFLYFLPDPQGQGSFRPTRGTSRLIVWTFCGAVAAAWSAMSRAR